MTDHHSTKEYSLVYLSTVLHTERGLVDGQGEPVDSTQGSVRLQLWMTVDRDEHRLRCGSGAIGSLRDVAVLASLPHGEPIACSSLDARLLRRLRRLDEGVVDWSEGYVRRRLRWPARIHSVVAHGDSWLSVAEALGSYVTVAKRIALIDQVHDDVLSDALVWGIGIIDGSGRFVLSPERPAVELGPFQWWLAERAYGCWLERERAQATT